MTPQQRILSKVSFNSPQQVKRAVGTLYHYFERSKEQHLVRITEWLYDQVRHHTEFEWKSVLRYFEGVLDLMKKT